MMETEVQAGPETDRAVAVVLGYAVWDGDGFMPRYPYLRWRPVMKVWGLYTVDCIGYKEWSPSTHWGDAMRAAEVTRLFGVGVGVLTQEFTGQGAPLWSIYLENIGRRFDAPTGPLAICAAILARATP